MCGNGLDWVIVSKLLVVCLTKSQFDPNAYQPIHLIFYGPPGTQKDNLDGKGIQPLRKYVLWTRGIAMCLWRMITEVAMTTGMELFKLKA